MINFNNEVRTYPGVPPASVFAAYAGTPIVIDSTTGNLYYLSSTGVVTAAAVTGPAAATAFTPTPNSFTVVLGGGSITYVGYLQVQARMVEWGIRIIPSGGATIAATVSSFFSPLPGISAPLVGGTFTVIDEGTGATLGSGYAYSGNSRIFMPAWTARSTTVLMSGSYLF